MDVKEEYMRSMSGLVKNNSERLKLFVQQLVQVDQKDGMLQCSQVYGVCVPVWLELMYTAANYIHVHFVTS